MGVNSAVLMGRLVADPELKSTGNGVEYCNFTVAVDRRFNKQGEERQADFIDCIAWRQSAVFVEKYFHKGSMIAVQGYIQTDMYEDKDGNKRKSVKIVADNVSFCGSKNENNSPGTSYAAAGAPNMNINADDEFKEVPEDDLPF